MELTEEMDRQVSLEELSKYINMPIKEIEDILKLAGDEIEVGEDEPEE